MDLHLQTMESFLNVQSQLVSKTISGRHITLASIQSLIQQFASTEIGRSVEKRPIQEITMGTGPIKILMWSQMHGNESTSTKGLLDVMCYLSQFPEMLASFTLKIIPMLNPDGANVYTRVNAAYVDLNRDALNQSQPEMKVLNNAYITFQPDYCFNLHDQRTIFGVDSHPCMLSFLAPAANEAKTITAARARAMGVIGYINKTLQCHIPHQVGRYNDSFNKNCTGDYFTSLGTPTLLFECGQVGTDYGRGNTRKWFGFSLLKALESIAKDCFELDNYVVIPEVEKSFVDVLLKNISYQDHTTDIALQYVEKPQNGKIFFHPVVADVGNFHVLKGHNTLDLSAQTLPIEKEINIGDDALWLADLLNLTQYSH